MSEITEDLLVAYALGELSEEEREGLEARLDADPSARAHARELLETFNAVALTAAEAAPTPALRDRVVATAQADRFLPFVDRLAALCDVGVAKAREFLGLIDAWEGWDLLMPGARFIDVDGGPALAGARPGLVRIDAGMRFPAHVHRGEELSFILQGTAILDDGGHMRPGDLIRMADGTIHGFTVTGPEPLVFAVILGDIELVDFVD